MAYSTTLLLFCFVCSVFAFAPSTRQVIEPFSPSVPKVYLTNINGSVVSPLPLIKKIASENLLEVSLSFVDQIIGSGVEYIVKSEYSTSFSNVHHAYLRQTIGGLEVFNADLNINLWKDQVLSLGHSFHFGTQKEVVGSKSAVEAVAAFAKFLGLSIRSLNTLPGATKTVQTIVGFPKVSEIKATLGWLILDGGKKLESVWDLEVDMHDHWYNAHVSATDLQVVSLHDRVNDASFEVYPIGVNDPHDGVRTTLLDPYDKVPSPLGWNEQSDTVRFHNTQGNNVYAQENWAGGSNWQTNARPDGGENLSFNFPIDFNLDARDYVNASTSNLFFWNNIIHDVFYMYGFDEVSGNFQENNFGKGGLGNDAVQANSQDGAGYNNANFATPVDGQRPRMRMYIWINSVPDRDGDLDSGIIIHEYAHGISTRLTGGPQNSNCLRTGEPGGMGEGWGDFFATALRQRASYTRDNVFPMGPYSANKPAGIRNYPYTTNTAINPETYGSVNSYTAVHPIGAVWAEILWEVYWSFVDALGFSADWYRGNGGNNQIIRDVVTGMKLQPCNPNFVDARDAIIQADNVNYKGANVCRLWKAFAKRGLGLKAVGTSTGVTKVTEDFTLPPECF